MSITTIFLSDQGNDGTIDIHKNNCTSRLARGKTVSRLKHPNEVILKRLNNHTWCDLESSAQRRSLRQWNRKEKNKTVKATEQFIHKTGDEDHRWKNLLCTAIPFCYLNYFITYIISLKNKNKNFINHTQSWESWYTILIKESATNQQLNKQMGRKYS